MHTTQIPQIERLVLLLTFDLGRIHRVHVKPWRHKKSFALRLAHLTIIYCFITLLFVPAGQYVRIGFTSCHLARDPRLLARIARWQSA